MSGPPPSETRVAAAALLRAALGGAGFRLLVRGQGPERSVALASGLTVGRGPGAALRLEGAGVSRLHARLRLREDGTAEVEDLGSKNGLRLNGRTVGGPAPLQPGDELVVGETSIRLVAPSREGERVADRPAERSGPAGPAPPSSGQLDGAAPADRASGGARARVALGLLLLAAAAILADAGLAGG